MMMTLHLRTLAPLVLLAGSVLAAANDVPNSTDTAEVFYIPPVVEAGEETLWGIDTSKSFGWEGFDEYKNMPEVVQMRIYLTAFAEEFEPGSSQKIKSDRYCVLSPCVWSNITRLAVTIPKDAFPPATRIIPSYVYYKSERGQFSRWELPTAAQFELSGGTPSWSDYELARGWSDLNQWNYQLHCEDVPCARGCVTEHLSVDFGPLFNHPRERRRAFERCMEGCKLYSESLQDGDTCIAANAVVGGTAPGSAPSTASGSAAATTSTTAAGPGDEGDKGGQAAASGLKVGLVGLIVGLMWAWLGPRVFQ